MTHITYSLLLAALFIPTTLSATDYTGKVVRILDGDTIEILHNQHPERIRLSGIGCPEKGRAYGTRAKQAAAEMVFGKEVTLQTYATISTGAPLPMCFCPMAPTSIKRW